MNSIFKRRSIRRFQDKAVDDETLKELLRAAMAAPSAGNEQPWHYIIINDRRVLDEIPKIHQYAQMCKEAPAAIIVCGDETLQKYEGYWVQDCAAATQNILLEVEEKGLGAVWCGIYPTMKRVEDFKKMFNMPENITPFSLIVLGYKGEEKEPANRYNESRVHYNKW